MSQETSAAFSCKKMKEKEKYYLSEPTLFNIIDFILQLLIEAEILRGSQIGRSTKGHNQTEVAKSRNI